MFLHSTAARRAFFSLIRPLPLPLALSLPTLFQFRSQRIFLFSLCFSFILSKYPTPAPLAQPLVVLEKKDFLSSFLSKIPLTPPPLLSWSFSSPSRSSSSFCAYAYKKDEASSYHIIRRFFLPGLVGEGEGCIQKIYKTKKPRMRNRRSYIMSEELRMGKEE